jgi:hypothetical protein
MQDTCSRVHSHGHAPAGCMQGACLACLVLAVRAHRERLRVCLQLARLRARNARAHTVTCAYALRFLPSVRCLCARPQCGVLSPRARRTTSFTCWSVVSLYRILSRFSFDSSSSSSSGSNVSSTKSAAPACPAVAAPAERSAADRTPPRRPPQSPPPGARTPHPRGAPRRGLSGQRPGAGRSRCSARATAPGAAGGLLSTTPGRSCHVEMGQPRCAAGCEQSTSRAVHTRRRAHRPHHASRAARMPRFALHTTLPSPHLPTRAPVCWRVSVSPPGSLGPVLGRGT